MPSGGSTSSKAVRPLRSFLVEICRISWSFNCTSSTFVADPPYRIVLGPLRDDALNKRIRTFPFALRIVGTCGIREVDKRLNPITGPLVASHCLLAI